MKWLIYLLLIFNIGFAAWHFRGMNAQQSGTDALEISNEAQLILLSEFEAQKEKIKAPTVDKLCHSLGPFTEKADAIKAQKLLKAEDVVTQRFRMRDMSRRGYWVILPATKTRKEANKYIRRLKKLKIKDYFLVVTGKHQNAVSLGVFSQKKLARARIDEMIRLGFIPRMESVALPKKMYWLNWYKDIKNQPNMKIINNLKKMYPKISKVERSCK